jgi:hypothetical protein
MLLVSKLYNINDGMINECGTDCGMRTGKSSCNSYRKLVPVPNCPLLIPHDLTWNQTWAAAVGSQ